MYAWNRYIPFLLLIFGITNQTYSQDQSYILKRQQYKVPLTTINISPDGTLLLAGFDNGSFSLLDPETFEVKLQVEGAHNKAVNAIDMPPSMDLILTAGGNAINLWDRNGKHLFDWNGHATTIWNAEISSNGKWAVSSAINKTFLLWNLNKNVIEEHMRGHEDVTMAVSISPDNRLIASGSNDLTVKIWDLESRQVISSLHGPTQDIYDVEFSPDSRLLVATSKDKSARLYDLEEEKLLYLLKGHSAMVLEAEFSPDGNSLITSSADESIILWDVKSGERIYQFIDNEGAITDLVFHPDGGSFYSISYAGDLTRWELNPEIFVLKFYEKQYGEELAAEAIFEPKRDGESKKEYLDRMEEAAVKKSEIIARYYQQYLGRREK
jgi:WD40 repeat protein